MRTIKPRCITDDGIIYFIMCYFTQASFAPLDSGCPYMGGFILVSRDSSPIYLSCNLWILIALPVLLLTGTFAVSPPSDMNSRAVRRSCSRQAHGANAIRHCHFCGEFQQTNIVFKGPIIVPEITSVVNFVTFKTLMLRFGMLI